jgi:ribonuclease HI
MKAISPYKEVEAEVYVDGSFHSGKSGWAAIVCFADSEISLNGWCNHNLETRNVVGEIEAVLQAIDYCTSRGFSCICINYDYDGIRKWVTEEWKRNKELTINYHNQVLNQPINIVFNKVKAHSGIRLNEKADRMAWIGAECGLQTV